MTTVLVTGAAGFIGSAVVARLIRDGARVVGLDNMNSYYDVRWKQARLRWLAEQPGAASFRFELCDIAEGGAVGELFRIEAPEIVIHLAGQASVRYGLENPIAYLNSNLIGHFNLLEACRVAPFPVRHFLYASSSSVYGTNEKVPFDESDDVSRPRSLYAATKRANELVTHSWSHQFGLPATGMRFFTVYGPWGRPDMSPMIFAEALLRGAPVPLFNAGDLWRDFTYVDDVVEAVARLIPAAPVATPAAPPHAIYNIGSEHPVRIADFLESLARALGVEASVDLRPWPRTEVYRTFANTGRLRQAVGWSPATSLADGLRLFARWYPDWHGKFAA